MNCMKCGREIKVDQVFCEICLEEMEKYPVQKDILVQLPRRNNFQPSKKANHRKRQALTAEEQVAVLKKKYRNAMIAFVATLLMAVSLGVLSGVTIKELDFQQLLGKNYNTVGESTSDTSSSVD